MHHNLGGPIGNLYIDYSGQTKLVKATFSVHDKYYIVDSHLYMGETQLYDIGNGPIMDVSEYMFTNEGITARSQNDTHYTRGCLPENYVIGHVKICGPGRVTQMSSSATASTKTKATKSYMRSPLGHQDDTPLNGSMNEEQEDYPAGEAYHHHGNENYAVRTEVREEVMYFSPIVLLLVGLVVGLTCGLICCLSCICTWFCCLKKHLQEPCLVVPKDDKSKASFDGVNYSMIPLKEESITR